MSWAIRLDGAGCRSVDSPEDVIKGFERYMATADGPPPEPIALPLTEEQAKASADLKRDELLAVAALRIAPLQDAIDLDLASQDDIERLNLWKKYRVAVNRISSAPGYPLDITWPVSPD
ncbi:tail fiber assembly protein [Pseudomonas sp. 1 R 17]|uniref:tail fiber assembly protein n=1 Tax=Pseudomonas sp. 1 R 17 TaxID=1844091 RepID=UPI003521CDE8